MSAPTLKAFTCLMVVLTLLAIVGAVEGEFYSTSYQWDFRNYSYVNFSQAMNFSDAPFQGVPYDKNLVGYWSMNEGSGSTVMDWSGNGNNGTATGTTIVAGKYGNARSFNGAGDYVSGSENASLCPNEGTLAAWAKPSSGGVSQVIWSNTDVNEHTGGQELSINVYKKPYILLGNGNADVVVVSSVAVSLDTWHFLCGVWNGSVLVLYVDGVFAGSTSYMNSRSNPTAPFYIGRYQTATAYFNGTIDDVRIYTRILSPTDIAASNAVGPYAHPDPISYAKYYNFTDSINNNTMLIHVDSPNANSKNVALVTCTNFFAGKKLVFQANNSATVNVWTNLGQPAFTTGVWNSENYTTTLTLDASSTAELNWNIYNITTYDDAHSTVSPSNVTAGYGGSQAFNFNASQGYGFNVAVDDAPQGQIGSYTFNNVTAPHTISVTSAQLTYTITASADAHSAIAPRNVSVTYGGNQLFNMTANSGYYISHVYVDGEDQGNVSSYNFTNVQSNHTISVSSAALAPTNPFPTETVLMVVAAIVTLIAVFALALKKGYITIEVVEESPEDQQCSVRAICEK